MKKPQVVLKNIKTFKGMEGYGLNADIYINGMKCMFVIDSANGGEFDYSDYSHNNPQAGQMKANIKLLTDYIANLPEEPLIINDKPYMKDGQVVMMKTNMDMYINDILVKQEEQKAEEKFEKAKLKMQVHSFLFGVPNAKEYRYIKYGKPLSAFEKGNLQQVYNAVKVKYCINNIVILNTNLKALGLTI